MKNLFALLLGLCLTTSLLGSPTIILIPGFDNSTEKFDNKAFELSLVDRLTATGMSVVPVSFSADVNSDSAVLELAERIDSSEPVILWGEGWGAIVASKFSATYPEQVRSIIFSNPTLVGKGEFENHPELEENALKNGQKEVFVSSSNWLVSPTEISQPVLLVTTINVYDFNPAQQAIQMLPAGSELLILFEDNIYASYDSVNMIFEAVKGFSVKSKVTDSAKKPIDLANKVAAVNSYSRPPTPPVVTAPPKSDEKVTKEIQVVEEQKEEARLECDMTEVFKADEQPQVDDISSKLRITSALSIVHDCAAAAGDGVNFYPSNIDGFLPDHAVIQLLKNSRFLPKKIMLTDAPCDYCTGAIIYAKVPEIEIHGAVKTNRKNIQILEDNGVTVSVVK